MPKTIFSPPHHRGGHCTSKRLANWVGALLPLLLVASVNAESNAKAQGNVNAQSSASHTLSEHASPIKSLASSQVPTPSLHHGFVDTRQELLFRIDDRYTKALVTDSACFTFGDPILLKQSAQTHLKLPVTAHCAGQHTLPIITLVASDTIEHLSGQTISIQSVADSTSIQLSQHFSDLTPLPHQQFRAEYRLKVTVPPQAISQLAVSIPLLQQAHVQFKQPPSDPSQTLSLLVNGERRCASWQSTPDGVDMVLRFDLRARDPRPLQLGNTQVTYHHDLDKSGVVINDVVRNAIASSDLDNSALGNSSVGKSAVGKSAVGKNNAAELASIQSLFSYGADFNNHFFDQSELSERNIAGLSVAENPPLTIAQPSADSTISSTQYQWVGKPNYSLSLADTKVLLGQQTTLLVSVDHPDAHTHTPDDLRHFSQMTEHFAISSAPYQVSYPSEHRITWQQDVVLKDIHASAIPALDFPYLDTEQNKLAMASSDALPITVKSQSRFHLGNFVDIDLEALKSPVTLNKAGLWSSDWHNLAYREPPSRTPMFYPLALALFALLTLPPVVRTKWHAWQQRPIHQFTLDAQRQDPHFALCRYLQRRTGHAVDLLSSQQLRQFLLSQDVPLAITQQVLLHIEQIEANRVYRMGYQQELKALKKWVNIIDRHLPKGAL